MTGEGAPQPQMSLEELAVAYAKGEVPSEQAMTGFLAEIQRQDRAVDEFEKNGKTIRILDYLDEAGPRAKDMILRYMGTPKSHPNYEGYTQAMQAAFDMYLPGRQDT